MAQTHARKVETPDSLTDAIHAGAQGVAEAGTGIYNAAVGQSKAMGRQVDGYVRDNSWYAIGIAAALGFIIGLMIRRR